MPERLLYDEAMLFSAVRLKIEDAELKQGKVETLRIETTKGIIERPWGVEGGFAVVYKFRTKSGYLRALRCFSVPMNADTQMRYEHIGTYFHTHVRDITAGFKYHKTGIMVKEQGKSQGQVYPVIEMDWIEGVTLVEKVSEHCRKRDRAGLSELIRQWLRILRMMQHAHIAHGDLSGVNVMINSEGKMLLIDYDGVYIPEFTGLPQVLVGQEDYQHPHMAQRLFGEHMDSFSALVIYTALLALEAQPELWDRYASFDANGNPLDVNLLFREQDFKYPQRSLLMQELQQSGSQQVRASVQELIRACLRPINEVSLPFILVDPDYDKKQMLEQLAGAIRSDDDEQIAGSWLPLLEQYEPAQRYRQRVQRAQQRVQALETFRTALNTQTMQLVVTAYDPMLLDACKNVTGIERQLLLYAQGFVQAYNADDDDMLLLAEAALQEPLAVQFFQLSSQEQQRLALASQRGAALETFRRTLDAAPRNARGIVAAYDASLLDTCKHINNTQREVVEAARLFLAMHEAVQTGLRAGDEYLIRRSYDAALARRFNDISPDEQQRIDNAMLSQALEDVLNNREYEQALRTAQIIQRTVGREISQSLTFKLKRATIRFIREHNLTALNAWIEERADSNYVVVQWQWPLDDLIQNALFVWCVDTWPEPPTESNLDRQYWSWRRSNQQDGMCTFPVGRCLHIFIRGYAAILDTWEQEQKWRFADGREQTSFTEAVCSRIIR